MPDALRRARTELISYLRTSLTTRRYRLVVWSLLVGLGVLSACAPSIDEREAVHVLTYDGVVDPVMEGYIDRGIDEAERTSARAVVIKLDTPGGLVSSMEGVVKRINASQVPVIVWVTPSGGQAASAGTFITMAGHIAAMSPATRIGAASPVAGGGEDIGGTLEEKITEDLAALLRGIAEERGRNVEWAELAVRRAVSANTSEAVEMNIVDFEAATLDDLLEQSEGHVVLVGPEANAVPLAVLDAPGGVVFNDRTFVERLFGFLADPNIAFLLLSLGATGLFIELLNPGLLFPGVFGLIALVLGFLALGTLPVNWAAVALILIAFALLVAEVFISGFGVLGLGGALALILGGLLLTNTSNPDFQVNRWLLYGVAAVLTAFFMMVMSALVRSRRAPPFQGPLAMVGEVALARSALDPEGFVFFQGARWRAESQSGRIDEGERVRVTEVEGLRLKVTKADDEAAAER